MRRVLGSGAVLVLWIGMVPVAAFCQEPAVSSTSVAGSSVAAAVAPARSSYRIGAGDVIEIKVLGEDQMSSPATRISADGFVSVPFIDEPIQAQCLTELELAGVIEGKLKKFLKFPEVYVSVKEFNSIPVAIIGAVNQPGRFQMQRRVSLLELLTYAGGVKQTAGKVAQLIHTNPEVVCGDAGTSPMPAAGVDESAAETLNLKRLLEGDAASNPIVRPGDIIIIPDADQVFVAGEVLKPNAYPLREGMTITQALALAGGPTRLAKTGSIHIMRSEPGKPRVEIPIDIKAIGKNLAPDVLLEANDVIAVPNSGGKTFLQGFVGALGGSIGNLPMTVVP